MVLDIDCIRALLTVIEERSTYSRSLVYPNDFSDCELDEYDDETLKYHIRQCEWSGLIMYSGKPDLGGHLYIKDLTPQGHEFVRNLRTPKVWSTIINKGGKFLKDVSIPVFAQIAATLAQQIIMGIIS